MKMVHHLHGQLFGIIVLVLQDIIQRADEEKGIDRQIAAAFFEVRPMKELVENLLIIITRSMIFADNAFETKIIAAVFIHFIQQCFLGKLTSLQKSQNQIVDVIVPGQIALHGQDEGNDEKQHDANVKNQNITSLYLWQPDQIACKGMPAAEQCCPQSFQPAPKGRAVQPEPEL